MAAFAVRGSRYRSHRDGGLRSHAVSRAHPRWRNPHHAAIDDRACTDVALRSPNALPCHARVTATAATSAGLLATANADPNGYPHIPRNSDSDLRARLLQGLRTHRARHLPRGVFRGFGSTTLPRGRCGEMIVAIVQVPCDRGAVFFGYSRCDILLPATNLRLQASPVCRQFLLAPMNLRRVASDTVGRIEQFAARVSHSGTLASKQGSGKYHGGYCHNHCDFHVFPTRPLQSAARGIGVARAI